MTEESYRVLLGAANLVSQASHRLGEYQRAGAIGKLRCDGLQGGMFALEQLFAVELSAAEQALGR